jgi:hypothetical protein
MAAPSDATMMQQIYAMLHGLQASMDTMRTEMDHRLKKLEGSQPAETVMLGRPARPDPRDSRYATPSSPGEGGASTGDGIAEDTTLAQDVSDRAPSGHLQRVLDAAHAATATAAATDALPPARHGTPIVPPSPSHSADSAGSSASADEGTGHVTAHVLTGGRLSTETETSEWRKDNGSLTAIYNTKVWTTTHGAVIIPQHATDLKAEILSAAHEQSGHGGTAGILGHMHKAKVTWRGARRDAQEHKATCPVCQRVKADLAFPDVGSITPRFPAGPMMRIVGDHVGPLATSANGFKHILVLVDSLTRWVELVPVKDLESATTAAALSQFIYRHGAPAEFQTDGHATFSGPAMQKLYESKSIHHHVSLAYHPQSQGITERCNQEVMRHLRAIVGTAYSTWDTTLPAVQSYINNTTNRSIGMSPYRARHGYDAKTAVSALTGVTPSLQSLSDLADAIRLSQAEALDAIVTAQETEIKAYNATHTPISYAVGDYCIVRREEREHKLQTVWRGLFRVAAKVSDNVYTLEDLRIPGSSINVHVTRMRRYRMERSTIDAELARLAPEGLYLVHKIIDHRYDNGVLAVKVWWQGYPMEDATWQDASTLTNITVFKEYCSENNISLARKSHKNKKVKNDPKPVATVPVPAPGAKSPGPDSHKPSSIRRSSRLQRV